MEVRYGAESAREVCRNTSAKLDYPADPVDATRERSKRSEWKFAAVAARTNSAPGQNHVLPRNKHNQKPGAREFSFRAHDIPQACHYGCRARSTPARSRSSWRSLPTTLTPGCCVCVSCFLNQMYEGLKKSPHRKTFSAGRPVARSLKCIRETQFPTTFEKSVPAMFENSISATSMN